MAILKKRPNYQIVHVQTNNATNYASTEILDKPLKLKKIVPKEY